MPQLCSTIPTRSRRSAARLAGVVAEHATRRRRCARGSPRGSRRSSSCPPRWARAGRTPRRGATVKSMPAHGLVLAVGLAQALDLDRGVTVTLHHGNIASRRMLCACIDIGSNTTRVLVADVARRAASREVAAAARVHPPRQGPEAGGEIPRAKIAEVAARRRRAARARRAARRAARCASSPRPRSAAPPTATSSPPRCASDGGVEVERARRRRRRRGWRSSARRARSGEPLAGQRRASSTSAAARPRSRSARSPAASTWCGVVPRRLRPPGRRATCAPTRRRPPSCDAMREHAARRASRASTCRRSTPPWRSAAAPPRCAGSSAPRSTRESLAARAAACSPAEPADDVAERFALDRERVRLMPAGLLVLDAAGARARPAAADRPRRPARRRPARAGAR